MKKIIPFKKEIIFKTNLSEITSISLEHTLQASSGNIISGEFIISGDYKMVDTSVNVEPFSFNIPFEVSIDEKYSVNNVIVDIYDFSYEVINNNVLAVNIEVIVEGLEEKVVEEQKELKVIEEVESEKIVEDVGESKVLEEVREEKEEKKVEVRKEEKREDVNNHHEEITNSLFDNLDNTTETYTTYKVYVVREGDTLDLLINNYGVTKEELSIYNNIDTINVGDKLIIPAKKDEKD